MTTTTPPTQIHVPSTSSLHPLAQLSITHPLHLGPHTYIHLRAHLFTSLAPLRIGAHCIVAEKAHVGLPRQLSSLSEGEEKKAEEIGNEEIIDRSGTDELRAKMVEQHVEVLKKAEKAAWKR
ncbi:MAG: hypothetical protein Q9208_008408 [Pyrenodesmia sp. 3 TL-2023]